MTNSAAVTKASAPPRGGLRYIPILAFATDLALVALAVIAAISGRETIPFPIEVQIGNTLDVAGPAIILIWVTAILMFGGYRPQVFGAGLDEYRCLVSASLLTAAAVGIGCFLLQLPLSRGFFVLAFLIGIPALVGGRFLLRSSIHRARARGALQQSVVIAGHESHVDDVAAVLSREKWLGYNVLGALTPEVGARSSTISGIPLLGSSSSVAEIAVGSGADVVFLAGGAVDSAAEVRRLAWDLEHEDIPVVIAPSVTDVARERIRMRPVGGLPLIHLEKPRSAEAARRAKRIFDIVGALGLLLLFAPVFAFASFRVWKHDRGPILFGQTRVGRDGCTFRCWKFRTMVTNAEALLVQLHAQQGYQGGLFKMEDDPRITPPGKWLRRYSIDELPQLVNVLKGDMSLVGPRPPLQHEVAQYDDAMARRLRVRPGMTGLWQVSGRSDLAWSEAIRLDLYYVDNWSMLQDLTILTRTFGAVFGRRGAY